MDTGTITVTFLFTDIQGSTRLWEEHPELMRRALERHDMLIRDAICVHDGEVFNTGGDAFCASFDSANAAISAAIELQRSLQAEPWQELGRIRVRTTVHTGLAQRRDNNYFGPSLSCAARLLEAAHGGQILVSLTSAEMIRDNLPPRASLMDLRLHRLRDLKRPERVYQLVHPDLPATFPPLNSISAAKSGQNNLPQQLTSFVGREAELAETKRLLERSRLLTLTGSGGCGKTRLAIQIAADLTGSYSDGVWLTELAALSDPLLVPHALAESLELREEPGVALVETITQFLSTQRCLLVLDNCEHLVEAVANLADRLLRACPRIVILASSRQPIEIPGEITWRVPSLDLPEAASVPVPPEAAIESESVRLFVERAMSSAPAFALTADNVAAVIRICRRLDGIPLAIELAAARVKVLTVQQIAVRLDDRFRLLTGGSRSALPRQQTLRALIDWSYDMLSPVEQMLLRRLAVFPGGCTLEAALSVYEDAGAQSLAPDPNETLDVLTRLIDRSLVSLEEGLEAPRYRLLETVREYGRGRMDEAGETASVQGHACRWLLRLAETAERNLQGPSQDLWLDRLECERDNLRAAIEKTEDPECALQLASALWRYWYVRGYLTEGRALLAHALSRRQGVSPGLVAKALKGAGNLAWPLGDLEAAEQFHSESLALYEQVDDREGVAGAWNNLGNLARDRGDLYTARDHYDQSLAQYGDAGYRPGVALALSNLGCIAMEQKSYGDARRYLTESLELQKELGDKFAATAVVHNLGELAEAEGDFDEAQERFREGLALRWEIGERARAPLSLSSLGIAARHRREYERAAILLAAAESARESLETPLTPVDQSVCNEHLEFVRAELSPEAFRTAWETGRSMPLDRAIAFALTDAPAYGGRQPAIHSNLGR